MRGSIGSSGAIRGVMRTTSIATIGRRTSLGK